MPPTERSETTELLRAWAQRQEGALEHLTPRVYLEFRRIAARSTRNRQPGQTIQPTALVHEAYLRLVDLGHVDWQDRAQFFACSAQIMRGILLDAARKRVAAKRGGGSPRVNIDEPMDIASSREKEVTNFLRTSPAFRPDSPRGRPYGSIAW
jgi:RNA polymerase sigma factor (TIGR02999 family)